MQRTLSLKASPDLQFQKQEFKAGIFDRSCDFHGVDGLSLGGEEADLGFFHIHRIIACAQLALQGSFEPAASYGSGDATDDSDEDDGFFGEGLAGAGSLGRALADGRFASLASNEQGGEAKEGEIWMVAQNRTPFQKKEREGW